ncbi:MAG: CCA tRNA nucleotidyltransferase [Chloroflexi bacterium]|nr:CCA tRNA nucleotidyltransferase [Chloroflexota bacterium]
MEILPTEALPERLRAALAGAAQGPVQAVAEEALGRGARPFLVGGSVRDLLLGLRAPVDLDIVLEGDAPPVAAALAQRYGWGLTEHRRFRTAVLRAGPLRLDLTSARRERYPRPGALPLVETPAGLEADLFRRDFTVNAMALSLSPESFGHLHDPYGGRSDLAAGLLRVLHDRSFEDDATRLWRACRYAGRLGLRLERRTARLARRDAGFVMSVGPDRVRHDLERVLREECPEKALALAHRCGLLAQVHPALLWDRWLSRRYAAARRLCAVATPSAGGNLPDVYWCLWLYRLRAPQIVGVLTALKLAGRRAALLEAIPALRVTVARLAPGARPSAVARRLDPFEPVLLQAACLAAGPGPRRRLLERYLTELRPLRPLLRGNDLTALGLPAGPALSQALAALRAARLDKRVKTREDEVALVRRLLRAGRPGPPKEEHA